MSTLKTTEHGITNKLTKQITVTLHKHHMCENTQ